MAKAFLFCRSIRSEHQDQTVGAIFLYEVRKPAVDRALEFFTTKERGIATVGGVDRFEIDAESKA